MNRILPLLFLSAFLSFYCPARAQTRQIVGASPHSLPARPVASPASDRERDGLRGPVRRVRTETAKLTPSAAQAEAERVLLEVSSYDLKGKKINNAYYPSAAAAPTGKEVYKYDGAGNITEMTLQAADGSVISKEIYTYEFDRLGNWTKMVASVAVVEKGEVFFEPTEATYRTISYYLESSTARLVQTGALSLGSPAPPATTQRSAPVTGSRSLGDVGGQQASAGAASKRPVKGGKRNGITLPVIATSLYQNSPYAFAFGATKEPLSNSEGGGGPLSMKMMEDPPLGPRSAPLRPISGGVLNGSAKHLPKPSYPSVAKRSRASGVVTVEVVVDESGRVISARATGGPLLLQQAAVTAATQARFSPTLLSGAPVKVVGVINYNFIYGQ